MRMIVIAALAALACPASAQEWSAPAPSRARWDMQAVGGTEYLRATSEDGEGPGKLMFLCNERHELVVMAMLAAGDADVIAGAASSAAWIIDGALARDAAPPGSQPVVMNGALMSLIGLDAAAFRRLQAAQSAGIVWLSGAGASQADFQIGLEDGRAPLAAFARTCNAQAYP